MKYSIEMHGLTVIRCLKCGSSRILYRGTISEDSVPPIVYSMYDCSDCGEKFSIDEKSEKDE